MKPIARMINSITFQFEQMVSQIENHEAVAEASLRQLRTDIRNAKVQSRMIQKDIEQTETQLKNKNEEILSWQKRAKKYAEVDQEKALHCVKQIKQCENEITLLEIRQKELQEVSLHLRTQLGKIEQQYLGMRTKIQSFASRDQVAGLKTTAINCSGNSDHIDDLFHRWEKKITAKEIDNDIEAGESLDEMQIEIEKEEEKQDLEMALKEILEKE